MTGYILAELTAALNAYEKFVNVCCENGIVVGDEWDVRTLHREYQSMTVEQVVEYCRERETATGDFWYRIAGIVEGELNRLENEQYDITLAG